MTRTRLLLCTGTLMLAALAACKDSPTQSTNTAPKKANIRIVEFMPNPIEVGENMAEWFRLKNLGDTAGSLVGWKIVDKDHVTWSLDTIGTLQPASDYKLVSPYQAELNNDGDAFGLINAAGDTIQWITYTQTDDGVSIAVP